MSNPDHRAEEYDALDDTYTRFLIDELLPEVSKKYRISDDPDQHIIGGTSSGAICAFTVCVAPTRCIPQSHQHDRQLHIHWLCACA